MLKLLDMGVDRLYTDYPKMLLTLKQDRQQFVNVACDGSYKHHLQGICKDKKVYLLVFHDNLGEDGFER